MGSQEGAREWTPPPRPAGKSLLGVLFDMNFDHMITTRLIKVGYGFGMLTATLFALLMAWYGLVFLAENTALGLLIIVASPFVWLISVLMGRLVLEFLINQFKITEYLRAIKDRD